MLSVQRISFSHNGLDQDKLNIRTLVANHAQDLKRRLEKRKQDAVDYSEFIKRFKKAVYHEDESVRKIDVLATSIRAKFAILPVLHSGALIPKVSSGVEINNIESSSNHNHLTSYVNPAFGSNPLNKEADNNSDGKQKTTEKLIHSEKEAQGETSFYDERLNVTLNVRSKRLLNDRKKQLQLSSKRMRHQLKTFTENKKSRVTQNVFINSDLEKNTQEIPNSEWWDSVILERDLDMIVDGKIAVRHNAITNLVEHPIYAQPPNEQRQVTCMPIFLTKLERRKLRRQSRREIQLEKREMIRLGLVEAPAPKLKISNFMRSLENSAIQGPTKIEEQVREQLSKRLKDHNNENQRQKLTNDQRREKIVKKIREDTSLGVHVSVYRIKSLHNDQSKKFKVEMNAKQLHMSGVVALFPECCVVAEGGPKQQRKFKSLMMHRIKWDIDSAQSKLINKEHKVSNLCEIVWEGKVDKRLFGEIKVHSFSTEHKTRDFFHRYQCEHYWDLAYAIRTSL